jgi:hypothetical protein
MAGLDPAIHVFATSDDQDVDARDKRGHDDEKEFPSWGWASKRRVSLA